MYFIYSIELCNS